MLTIEQKRRILVALQETDAYIAKESPRDPALRPASVKKILADYVAHRSKLLRMLDQNTLTPQ